MRESVVLCEGYWDRAFWAGWLLHMGCQSLKPPPGKPVFDPWGKVVKGGAYAYLSKSGGFLRVVPLEGKGDLVSVAQGLLTERATRPLARLVLNRDSDKVAHAVQTHATNITDYAANIVPSDGSFVANTDDELELDNGATKVALIRWEANDPTAPGLPDQQTLERLVCASLCAAYPERGRCVQAWLDARCEPQLFTVKAFAWSYMAGWHAERGCDDFYRCLWEDALVVQELEARLRASGA